MSNERHTQMWAHGADMVVGQLEAQGVKHVFGIPGAKIDKVFDSLLIPRLNLFRYATKRTPRLWRQRSGVSPAKRA